MDKHLLTLEKFRSIKTSKRIIIIVREVPWRKWHLSEVQKPVMLVSRGKLFQADGTACAKALR